MAAKIVAAEREVPGNTAASIWQAPTQKATDQVASATGARSFTSHSTSSMSTPPTISAPATGAMVVGRPTPSFLAISPPTAVISEGQTRA